MALKDGRLSLNFYDLNLGVSARRIWEHTQHRQINPFPAVTSQTARDPEAFVDVVDISGPYDKYIGITLEQVRRGQQWLFPSENSAELLVVVNQNITRQWLMHEGRLLHDALDRKAVRNAPERFLPTDQSSPLGIKGLRCVLADWLDAHGKEKALSGQWYNRIYNLTQKGLKQGEMEATGIKFFLLEDMPDDIPLDGELLRAELSYSRYRLSIIPVVKPVADHLMWRQALDTRHIKRIKPKIRGKHPSIPLWYDPVMGYWVDRVEWKDLLGHSHGWMVFNHRGRPLVTLDQPYGLYNSVEEAKARANRDAARVLPKLSAKGNWAQYRLTGGENYREWLVTLPYYPHSYFSSHFTHRNALLHVRCDIREGAEGEKVLFLQEVLSDWTQQARREMRRTTVEEQRIPTPPWMQEWPALALKLMLLHACEQGCDALAWTTGEEQVKRYRGLGERGLIELYDRTLPKAATKILKPFGIKCETIDVFLPVNFFIEPTETGYEVLDDSEQVIGEAPTWRQTQKLIPDGAHEKLTAMHGIALQELARRAISLSGFQAWGIGLNES